MDAVIFAAGKGSRLAPLTDTTPKPLLSVKGVPILGQTLDSLPPQISRVFVIVDYLAEQIESFCSNRKDSSKILCLRQIPERGTLAALKTAAPFLGERFLVLNGDDIISPEDLEQFTATPRALGVARASRGYYKHIDTDAAGIVTGLRTPTEDERAAGILIATGSYVLDHGVFALPPVAILNGESGLPQTIIAATGTYPVTAIELSSWIPINTHEDLAAARSSESGPVAGQPSVC